MILDNGDWGWLIMVDGYSFKPFITTDFVPHVLILCGKNTQTPHPRSVL